MRPPQSKGSPDNFQTPPIAAAYLLKYLPKDRIIWECAAGKGNLAKFFMENGYKVIQSDILTDQDFLTWKPDAFDVIVTNPPYSIKEKFLERCYSLGKPFALLLPLTTFETKKRQALFRQYGLQVLFLPNRINFETPSGQGGGQLVCHSMVHPWSQSA